MSVPPKPGFIDAHIHVWPESGDRAKPSRYTAEDHFAIAEPAGVTRTVLIQPGMFRVDNSYMLNAVRTHPGVFSAVAVVDADAAELERTVDQLRGQGVRGFRISARKDKPWSEWEGMQRLWGIAGKRGISMCPLINPDAFPWVAALCETHPEATVAIDHLGRVGASGAILDSEVRALCGLARFPRVHVKVSAFYALGKKARTLHGPGPDDPPGFRDIRTAPINVGKRCALSGSAAAQLRSSRNSGARASAIRQPRRPRVGAW